MKNEIIEKEEELRQAMLKSDVEALNNLIEDSLVFVSPNGQVATKQMDIEAHKTKIQVLTELTPSNQQVVIQNDAVIVTVEMKLSGSFLKEDISGNYRYLRVWAKKDGTWKVIAGSVSKITC